MRPESIDNGMLDARYPSGAGNCLLSTHSGYSTTGASLLGAKTSANFAAAASRTKALAAACDIAVTAGNTVKWLGIWDAAGTTFLGMYPNGGSDKSFQVDLTNNRVHCEGHGFADGDKITFHNDTAPTGLTAGTTYFVVTTTAGDPDHFQVSATSGGAAIDLTGQHGGKCLVSKIVEETYAADGTHRINPFSISL